MFGYARTMAYTFHPDHHGEVTAEHLNQPDLEPFLGLHYPASDIPPQARRLYVLQLVRVIEDVDGPTVHLLGPASDGEPPPARSHLRAPSRGLTGAPGVHCATWAWPPRRRCRSSNMDG